MIPDEPQADGLQFSDVKRGAEVTLCRIERQELQERRAIILGVGAAVMATLALWAVGLVLMGV
jgi:hypothetical protein